MDKKTGGMIGLVVTILCCGLPGLCGLCMGPLYAVIGMIPGADLDTFGSADPGAAIGFGIATLCVGVLFVAVPAAVWYFAVRTKPEAAEAVIEYDEPMPEDM